MICIIGENNVSETENKEADDVLDGKLSDSSDGNKSADIALSMILRNMV